MANRNRWWKVLGVASVVGVAATGALVARDERQRRAYTPDEVRDRLRERLEQSSTPSADSPR
jgi:cytochrome c-type biogenesis protein CcmE